MTCLMWRMLMTIRWAWTLVDWVTVRQVTLHGDPHLKQRNLASSSSAELMVVCLNLSEGQWALEARLIGRSTTTTLKTILYIESTVKSAYSTGHSDWLFSFKKINVDAPKEKLKSAEHHNGTTVWRRENAPSSLSDQAGSLTWPRGAFCAPHAVNKHELCGQLGAGCRVFLSMLRPKVALGTCSGHQQCR